MFSNYFKIRLPTFVIFYALINSGCTIECFKCVSLNKQNKACDDPFHNNYTADILESPCLGGRKGRNGLFPATACIKLSGVYGGSEEYVALNFKCYLGLFNVIGVVFYSYNIILQLLAALGTCTAIILCIYAKDTGDTIMIRGCALDSGTLTTDTEIIRMSHCGGFYFEERYVRGCLQSCDDADACNVTTRITFFKTFPIFMYLCLLLIV